MKFDQYELSIAGPEGQRYIQGKFQNGKAVDFTGDTSKKGLPKLYVICSEVGVIYVGCTRQPIGNRLRYGLNPVGAKAYHGYQWMRTGNVILRIWTFPDAIQNGDTGKALIEGIESELVFLIRLRTGRWPENQTEIHFNNLFSEQAQSVAEKIYNQLFPE